ncbi:MAG: glycosyltransferase family 9 protein [Opitutaceae bacterium]
MRILVSKPDSLGDQLIIAGWLQALADAVPSGCIVWHVQAGMEIVASLLEGVSTFVPSTTYSPEDEARRFERDVSKGLVVVPFDLPPFGEWSTSTDARLAWWTAFVGAQSWHAAVAAVGNRTWVAELTVAASNAPLRVGAVANPSRQIPVNAAGHFISQCSPLFHQEISYSLAAGESESLGRLFSALGIPLPLHPQARLRSLPAVERQQRILFAPGVGGPAYRAWPVSHFLSLAGTLRSAGRVVEWIEGPRDRAFLDPIRAERTERIHAVGSGDLIELAQLLRSSDALICNDTAYAHLAALLGVPTVALFGGGQGQRFHPVPGLVKVVQGIPACAGCQWHCVHTTYPCVSEIPIATVFDAIVSLLSANDRSPVFVAQTFAANTDPVSLIARLQQEILHLDADRFARLQIIQSLVDPTRGLASAPVHPTPRSEFLSVIIPVGRPDRALGTLSSLAAQVPVPDRWEVIVVGADLKSLSTPPPGLPLRSVALAGRSSPAETRIAGVAAAQGQWYLFVDDDIELAPHFLERARILIAGLEATASGAGYGAIGARLPGRTGRFWERVTDLSNFWSQQSRESRTCDWLYSAALLVKAKAYHEAGGFDPTFPVGEDVDLTQRIAGRGYTLRYEPSLVAHHHHRRDSAFTMWRYFWHNGNGARFFFRFLGGACAFSIKTVWLKTWSDLRMNQKFQRQQGMPLGLLTPLVWLNYLIVETSLEWHWQSHLHKDRNYLNLPARARSDATYVSAMKHWDAGRRIRGVAAYVVAMMQDFGNPVRR